ncbi:MULTISPECIES: GntR family transcriptional regulator [unclassified Streptomyces]|uniref:GntR family transcriptional regulator n=1 Tax=unclassified Streptomyces TaxID=2593676 RepID=UPI00247589D8|nr:MULTISPECIES: GntR family transcriptional regulator [unclassified Streptomyces]MDH6451117.1 DNA-binding transcriptional regulator YhcF (GntR family) [Streptomyces sp. SAI-119]MDH6498328.1 DNA-binding transcriptional regulator YhcF (GntR family) [Streptomyces sp. SAI-149]
MSDVNAGEGGGKEFERVAGELRARLTDGVYPVDRLLPSQRVLAEEFGVSRDTIQRVLRELSNEGWIVSRQGSGSRVVRGQRIHSPTSGRQPDRMVTLRPLIDHAFEQPEVMLDVFTLTSESLDTHIRLQAERIRLHQIAPQRIAVRMLLPSESLQPPYWRTGRAADDELLEERYLAISRRHTASVRSVLRNLEAEALVPSVDVQIRQVELMPHAKLYLLNGVEAVYGPYKAYQRSIVLDDGKEIEDALDVVGLGAGLTHHVKDPHDPYAPGTVFVDGMREWFDSAWKYLTGQRATAAQRTPPGP